MATEVYNPNPTIFKPAQSSKHTSEKLWIDDDESDSSELEDDNVVEPIDRDEIFELIRNIRDPEHPNTLEELAVVSAPQVTVNENHVVVEFTPTIPHCGMSSFIGLSIRYRLLCSLPPRFKVDIRLKPGSHVSEASLTKQINDKERVAAALEAPTILRSLQDLLKDIDS